MSQEETIFTLSYKDLLIGQLMWRNEQWTFGYSNAFRSQNEIAPLVSFSDVKRVYESSELWPFLLVGFWVPAGSRFELSLLKKGLMNTTWQLCLPALVGRR